MFHVQLDKRETAWLDDAQMVPGRPFAKGQSGNITGRPAGYAEVRAAAREKTQEALDVLVSALQATKPYGKEGIHSEDWQARITAATAILDRGWGKPTQAVKVTQEDQHMLEALPDAELLAIATGKPS